MYVFGGACEEQRWKTVACRLRWLGSRDGFGVGKNADNIESTSGEDIGGVPILVCSCSRSSISSRSSTRSSKLKSPSGARHLLFPGNGESVFHFASR